MLSTQFSGGTDPISQFSIHPVNDGAAKPLCYGDQSEESNLCRSNRRLTAMLKNGGGGEEMLSLAIANLGIIPNLDFSILKYITQVPKKKDWNFTEGWKECLGVSQ